MPPGFVLFTQVWRWLKYHSAPTFPTFFSDETEQSQEQNGSLSQSDWNEVPADSELPAAAPAAADGDDGSDEPQIEEPQDPLMFIQVTVS